MEQYSKSYERDENRKMNKAFFRSLWGVLLCWAPLVGILFAAGGFVRMCVRLTRAHRVKRFFLTLFSLIVLLAVLGLQVAGAYYIIRDPAIVEEGLTRVWTTLTGQETLPGRAPAGGDFYDYDYNDDPYEDDVYSDSGDDAPEGDDYDADFDDSYMQPFPEDEEGDATADGVDYNQRELFDQMLENKRSGEITLP